MSESVQFLKFVISGDDAELAEAVARSRKTVTGLFDAQTTGAKRLVDSSVYVNGWREALLEASGAEQRMSATALFESQHQSAKKLATDSGYVDFWVKSLQQQEAAEKKLASDNAFLKSLQDRSSQIGKTTADILELQAAERGLSAQAAPMISKLRQAEQSFGATGISAAQTAAAMRMVPAQFTDIVVSLQAGQQPLTVLLQQGGQLKDMFGGAGAAARGMAGYIVGLINPYTVAAGVVGALALAYYKGSQEADAYNKAIIMTGNAAGVTTERLSEMSAAISERGFTKSAAADALAQIVSTGHVASESLTLVGEAALQLERRAGIPVKNTVKDFEELGKSPVAASIKLTEQHRYLTAAIFEQIKSLQEQGRESEAAELAQKTYADAMLARSSQLQGHLGYVERAWEAIKREASGAWDAMLDVGRERSPLEKASQAVDAAQKELDDRLARNQSLGIRSGKATQEIRDRLTSAQDFKQFIAGSLDGISKLEAESTRIQQEGVKAANAVSQANERSLSATARTNKALKEYRDNLDAIRKANPADAMLDPATIARTEAYIREQNKDKKAASAAKHEETAYEKLISSIRTKVDEVKKELEVERELTDSQKIRAKLDNDVAAGRLKLTAVHRASVEAAMSDLEAQEKLADARKGRKLTDQLLSDSALLAPEFAQQWRQISAAYDGTAESLDRLTQAQAVLLAKQPFAQQATAIAQSRAEAEQYLATMQRAQGREVQLVGMGGRQREYFNGINQIEDTYASRRYDLGRDRERERVRSGGELSQKLKDYYDQQFALNDEFERKAKASFSSTFEAIGQAQSSWLNGATRAFDDYAASAANAAEQTAGVFNRVYSGFEDNAVSFAMTGKSSFKDYAQSVISDLIRIQLRAQMVSVLGGARGNGLLGSLIAGVTSLFGGGMAAAGVQASGAETAAVTGWGSVGAVDLGPVAGNRVNGGPVMAGNLYEVNEKKIPELLNIGDQQFLMMAGANGYVTPLQAAAGGGVSSGQPAPVHVDVQVINQGAPAQARVQTENRADGSVGIKLILNAVADDMASGGVTARAARQRFNLAEA